jgi:hypothetical protein
MKNITLNLLSLLFILPVSLAAKPVKDHFDNYPNYGIFSYNVPTKIKLDKDKLKADATNYANYNFKKGVVQISELSLPLEIRYNITNDEMECKIKNQFCKITSPKDVLSIKIGNKKFVYKQFTFKKKNMFGYLQEVHSRGKKVYLKYYTQGINKKTRVAKIKTYYLIEKKNELPKVIKNPKEVITLFYSDQEKTAKEYMLTNNLKWNNSNDFILLLNHLDNFSDNVASR